MICRRRRFQQREALCAASPVTLAADAAAARQDYISTSWRAMPRAMRAGMMSAPSGARALSAPRFWSQAQRDVARAAGAACFA